MFYRTIDQSGTLFDKLARQNRLFHFSWPVMHAAMGRSHTEFETLQPKYPQDFDLGGGNDRIGRSG